MNFLSKENRFDPQLELEKKTDNDGATPLHMAVSSGDIDMILYLLNQGCDTNSKNNEGQTPLHLSMAFTDDFIARALIAYNSDMSIADKHGNKPYDIAINRGNRNLSDTIRLIQSREERPDRDEISSEAAQREISKNQKMRIIAFKNNEKAKKKFLSNSNFNTQPNINSNPIHDDDDHRFQDLESKIEELNESMTKLKAKVLTSPQQTLQTKTNLECIGCLSTHATKCPTCGSNFCEICMQKPKYHKCAEKH